MTQQTVIDPHELMSRQAAILAPASTLATGLIIGCGMLGSWTALALGRFLAELHVWDFDVVEGVNVGSQAYTVEDIGEFKAAALAKHLAGLAVTAHPVAMPDKTFTDLVERRQADGQPYFVVSAVDSLDVRRKLARLCKARHVPLFIDTRAQAELGVVATAVDYLGANTYDEYIKTIPKDDEVEDVPCGERGTAYVGMWVAQQVAVTVQQFYRGVAPEGLVVQHIGLGQRV